MHTRIGFILQELFDSGNASIKISISTRATMDNEYMKLVQALENASNHTVRSWQITHRDFTDVERWETYEMSKFHVNNLESLLAHVEITDMQFFPSYMKLFHYRKLMKVLEDSQYLF